MHLTSAGSPSHLDSCSISQSCLLLVFIKWQPTPPWMEEPGGLQPMGSQRVGHNWATLPYLTLPFYAWTLCLDSWETQGTQKRIPSLLSRHPQSHEWDRSGAGGLRWSGRVPCLFVPAPTIARWMMFLRCFLVVTHSGVLSSWQRCGSGC